jgi:hypothetical protein
MELNEYITGKIIRLQEAIKANEIYINSADASIHRNLRARAIKAVKLWNEELNRFKLNQLNDMDMYYYRELYADKPFNRETIKEDFSL